MLEFISDNICIILPCSAAVIIILLLFTKRDMSFENARSHIVTMAIFAAKNNNPDVLAGTLMNDFEKFMSAHEINFKTILRKNHLLDKKDKIRISDIKKAGQLFVAYKSMSERHDSEV